MQIFEFHFNPKTKNDLIFDSFCYDPENLYEKRVGSLYMAGLLRNVLPRNIRFLDNLAKTIKERYYKAVSSSPEKSLKDSLKEANRFLEKVARGGDVSWLGNLSFIAMAFKNLEFYFTKVGEIKIFLIRKGQVIDIDKNIKLEEIEPYPLKVFPNIISGKLAENDILLILTKEAVSRFLENNLLNEIARLSPFDQKGLKQVFNAKKNDLLKIFGVCLVIFLTKETLSKEKEDFNQTFAFSLKEVFRPVISLFKLPEIKMPQISFKKPNLKLPRVKSPQLKLPHFEFNLALPKLPKLKKIAFPSKNKLNLILFFILLLIGGYFVFEKGEQRQLATYREKLSQIQETANQAESYLIIAGNNAKAKQKAISLLKDGLEKISSLSSIAATFPANFSNEVLNLEKDISENLYSLNGLTEIAEPQIVFEFKLKDFIPQKMIYFKDNLYFFSPYSQNIFKVDKENKGETIALNQKINLAAAINDSILFFSKPNQLIGFNGTNFQDQISLQSPYPDFNFNSFSTYQSNLYFLDSNSVKVIKYPYKGNSLWQEPQLWLSLKTKTANDLKSMAIDGSVWILTKENSIERYYAGVFQNTLKVDIFPYPKQFSKILTLFPNSYLYLLEPVQNRIVILDKTGQIIKQYQSEKFDSLLDFTVSEDGKTIYLLNGLKVYKISTADY